MLALAQAWLIEYGLTVIFSEWLKKRRLALAETRLAGENASPMRLGAGALTVGVAYVLLISWLDPALPWPATFNSVQPWWLALLNVIPVLMLTAILVVITRRLVLSTWLTLVALAVLYAINHLKVRELATPLLPDDFHFLRALGVNYSFFSHYLTGVRTQLLIAAGVFVVTLMLSREPVIASLRGLRRAVAAAIAIALVITLFQGRMPWTHIYDPGRLQFEPWAPSDSAARTGVITNMLLFYWELRGSGQQQPDLSNAIRLARDAGLTPPEAAEVLAAADELPDIIIVQSESLLDPARLPGTAGAVLSRMHASAARGWSGDLYVPTFGGGTIRTEFEVLTGLPLAAFPHVRYPYLQLTRREFPGLVRLLGEQGYRTLAIHPNGGAFWNRNHAFRVMGFDRFMDSSEFEDAHRYGWYVSDAALTDKIIAEMTDDGAPQLIMGISIQNHGPYAPHGELQADAATAADAALSEEAREMFATYVSLLRATDEQIGRLVDFVESRSRRTLLLVYSDHLPPLNAVYESVGFQDGRPAREQPVPWMLFDNRSNDSLSRDIASWSLPGMLLSRAGIPRDRYFHALEEATNEERLSHSGFEAGDLVRALAQLHYWDRLDEVFEEIDEPSAD
ncbi:LTA synthase family protein [Povalibacter sp.]|uniref:LTA synthase family protein n=1 Tax=Povalibacter sp. TaxID=1962978 RepID=UPI002F42586F